MGKLSMEEFLEALEKGAICHKNETSYYRFDLASNKVFLRDFDNKDTFLGWDCIHNKYDLYDLYTDDYVILDLTPMYKNDINALINS